jgi:hypothetical protein
MKYGIDANPDKFAWDPVGISVPTNPKTWQEAMRNKELRTPLIPPSSSGLDCKNNMHKK